jgi:hypothetical protein
MKSDLIDSVVLISLAEQVGGVFSLTELSALFQISNPLLLNRKIKGFIVAGALRRYCRGIYVVQEFSPEVLAQKVRPRSYISLGSALARHRMIGTEPRFQVSSLDTSPAAEFKGEPILSFGQVSESMLFGFDILDKGIRVADPEKALLDTLYFHLKGRRYFFQLFNDVSVDRIDRVKYESYLTRFQNPKFVAFAKRYLDGVFSDD